MKANVLSRQNAMASNILIGNAKAEEEVQLNLLDLSENEKELILKVLERDKLLQNELSVQLQLSTTEKINSKDELFSDAQDKGMLIKSLLI